LRPVNLIQIDHIYVKPLQACFQFLTDGGELEAVTDLSLLIPYTAALGEDIRAL